MKKKLGCWSTTLALLGIAVASATNAKGEVLLAWTEGTGWPKGGALAWQVFDKESRPTDAKGRIDGVPIWSLPTAYAQPDDRFVIVY